MSTNPYAPPTSDVTIEDVTPEVPAEILKKIKGAWVAGLISAAMTLLVTVLTISGSKVAGFNAWNFIDVVLILALAFGIFKKSRTCAVIMFAYFVISKILIVMNTGRFDGAVMAIAFLYFYAQGMAGTFAYHKHLKG